MFYKNLWGGEGGGAGSTLIPKEIEVQRENIF